MTVDGQVHSTRDCNREPTTSRSPRLRTMSRMAGSHRLGRRQRCGIHRRYRRHCRHLCLPVSGDCYWVTFNTTGGGMVASAPLRRARLLTSAPSPFPTAPAAASRAGAPLPDGANVVTSIAPTAATTLYAVWEGDNVIYTVVYWGENPNNTATENIRLTRFSVPNPRPPKSARPSPVPPARQATIQLKLFHISQQ